MGSEWFKKIRHSPVNRFTLFTIRYFEALKMKKYYRLFFLLLATLLLAEQATNAQTAKAVSTSALLYRIEGKGLKKPSYLFGTIHLICEKDMFSPATMKTYLDQTGQLMLEMDMDDPAAVKKVMDGSLLKNGQTVKDLIKPEDYAKLDAVYKSYLGISFDLLGSYKPIVSSTMLYISPKIMGCQAPKGYETELAAAVAPRKLPVLGLETAEEQIAVLDSQPLNDQLKWLTDIANNPQKPIDEFQQLSRVYLAQDSDALYDLAASGMKESGLSQAKMLDERNIRWIPAIEKTIGVTPTFIAVGAAHLGGTNGVVSLLRAKGYTLTPIRF
jgi:uncharacterized protein